MHYLYVIFRDRATSELFLFIVSTDLQRLSAACSVVQCYSSRFFEQRVHMNNEYV